MVFGGVLGGDQELHEFEDVVLESSAESLALQGGEFFCDFHNFTKQFASQ